MLNVWTTKTKEIEATENRLARLSDGALLSEELQKMGITATHIDTIESPSAYIHNFSIENPLHLLKLEQARKILSLRFQSTLSFGCGQGSSACLSDFSFTVDKATTTPIYWETHKTALKKPFDFLLGIDTNNEVITSNIADLPHLLIAGETGSGKSVALHTILQSLIESPNIPADGLGLVLVDTKQTELVQYENSKYLACSIAKNYTDAYASISALCREMDERYKLMSRLGTSVCPYARMVLVIDELADLMLMSKANIEPKIVRLAQMGRAANIHLILATQRPTVDVCTGHIKANIHSRIALQVASARDSMNIIDSKGAESLRGKGDALIKLAGDCKTRRIQCFANRSEQGGEKSDDVPVSQ